MSSPQISENEKNDWNDCGNGTAKKGSPRKSILCLGAEFTVKEEKHAVVGGIIAGVVIILTIIAIIVLCLRRKRSK